MATLEKIRNQAGLLVIIVGLALFAFIIGDFLNSGSTYMRQSQDQVVKVNGISINSQEYNNRIDETTKIYKMQLNSNNLNEEQNIQVRQSVYESLVNEIILKGAIEKLTLSVTPEELFDMIQGENISPMVQQFPLFIDPETGIFDKMRALNVLKTIENHESVPSEYREEVEQIRDYWLYWEHNMKMQSMQDKYLALLSKAVVANPLEAKDAFESSLSSSDIVYTMQSFATIPDSVISISDSDIKKIYNQRKEQFKQKETRIFDFIAIDINPSPEDYEQVQKEANKIMDELVDAERVEDVVNANSEAPYINAFVSVDGLDDDMKLFVETAELGDVEGPLFREDSYRIFKLMDKTVAPDSVNVSHIFLSLQYLNQESLTAMADSLMGVLKAGENFEMLATQYSMDQSTNQMGGTIGWLTEWDALNYFGENFKNEIFSSPINQPVMLVEPYGVHILKVTEKTTNVPKYKLAYVHLSVTPSTKTYTNLYNELIQFISMNNTSEKMEAAANDAGYTFNSNVSITAEDRYFGGIPDSRPVVRWVFESKKKGEISRIFEGKNHFIIAVRKGILPEGYQSIQSVRPMLQAELIAQQKGEIIARELKSKNLHTIDAYAEIMGNQVDTVRFIDFKTTRIAGVGLEPKLNAAISQVPLNMISEPIVGNNGVYIFSVINRDKNVVDYNAQDEMSKIEEEVSFRSGLATFQSLMNKAKIEDNRIRFE